MAYPIVELGEELSINNINGKITSFAVIEVKENPYKKLVSAEVVLNIGLKLPSILLWKDAEYDKAGQWTDIDIQNTLIPMVKEQIKSFPSPPKPVTLEPFILPQPKQPEVKNTFPGFFPNPSQ